jgi:hypothetical protein
MVGIQHVKGASEVSIELCVCRKKVVEGENERRNTSESPLHIPLSG